MKLIQIRKKINQTATWYPIKIFGLDCGSMIVIFFCRYLTCFKFTWNWNFRFGSVLRCTQVNFLNFGSGYSWMEFYCRVCACCVLISKRTLIFRSGYLPTKMILSCSDLVADKEFYILIFYDLHNASSILLLILFLPVRNFTDYYSTLNWCLLHQLSPDFSHINFKLFYWRSSVSTYPKKFCEKIV